MATESSGRRTYIMLGLIVLGVLAGGLLGWYSAAAAGQVAWLGTLFLNTLSMLVIPLLISAVITDVTSLGDVRELGRIGGITIAYYLITLAIAVFIGLIMVNLIAAAANTELLPLIIWSIAFGVAITTLGESGQPAARFFASFNNAMMRLVGWVMYFTPLGVFGLVAGRLAEAGGGERFIEDIQGIGLHIVTVLSGLAIHFTVLVLILILVARHPPSYLLGMLRAIMTAFATASSSAKVWGDAVGAAVLTHYLPPEVSEQPPLVGPMDL